MSRNIMSSFSNHNPVVNNTSFSGGVVRGRCFQMTQMKDGQAHVVQMTKEQVTNQIKVMVDWMSE